jgi:hypothetical protein
MKIIKHRDDRCSGSVPVPEVTGEYTGAPT